MRSTRLKTIWCAATTALVVAVTGSSAGAVPAGAGEGVLTGPAAPQAVLASLTDEYTFVGHGWGHGRGMGQYGSLGYAVDHGWGYRQILDHFYGGTTLGSISGNPAFTEMTVELLSLEGRPLVVTGSSLTVNGVSVGSAARLTATPAGVTVERGTGCVSSAWTPVPGSFPVNATRVRSAVPQGGLDTLVRVCETAVERAYRGELSVVWNGIRQLTVNHLPTEQYLRGVVPRESPAGWATLGGGRGAEALKAQSVAARSYALSARRPSGAWTCDTTACQVYGGAGFRTTTWTSLEDARTDAAISATAGEVRMRAGKVVRTEFSSSTGGWTAGGEFPAVVDEGDDVAANPNHTWTTKRTGAQIAAALGITGLRSVTVTRRNGLGDLGGRVLEVAVVDGNGVRHTRTGAQFRTALGTSSFKSDWFAVTSISTEEAQSVVRALYQDLLLRPVDPSGLNTWTTKLLTGTSQSELVRFLTSSEEYIRLRITQAYQEVLGRAPDPGGMTHWRNEIAAGRATVDDVKRRFYDSQEYYNRSGGTPEGYIDLLYRTMFARPASAWEIAHWTARIGEIGRSRVVDSIWFSMEAAMYRAGGYYRVFLQREPDRTGQEHWARVLLTSGEGAVRMGIAGSLEYKLLAIRRFP